MVVAEGEAVGGGGGGGSTWVCFSGDFLFSPFLRGLLGIIVYFFGLS